MMDGYGKNNNNKILQDAMKRHPVESINFDNVKYYGVAALCIGGLIFAAYQLSSYLSNSDGIVFANKNIEIYRTQNPDKTIEYKILIIGNNVKIKAIRK